MSKPEDAKALDVYLSVASERMAELESKIASLSIANTYFDPETKTRHVRVRKGKNK